MEKERDSAVSWIDRLKNHKTTFLILYTLLLAGAFALLLFYRPMVVSGSSMYPTFQDNDRILVDRFDGNLDQLNRGDVIVFFSPEVEARLMVKRLIGLPGDTICILEGHVYLNGALLKESYTNRGESSHETIPSFRVPMDAIFVLGDNRLVSADSREWGAIDKSRIYGRIIHRFEP